jgi:hypothetical protein
VKEKSRRAARAAGTVLLGLAVFLATRAAAQEGPIGTALFVLGNPGGSGDFARYRFEDAFGRAGEPTITDHRFDAGVVVSSTPVDSWAVNEHFEHFGLNAPVQIPDGPAVPQSLWSEETGVRYARQMEAGRAWGVSAIVGYESDVLFNSIHETSLSLTLDAKVPSGDRNAWLFFLNYSNNRYFLNNVPVPGVAYQFQTESGDLRGLVGIPFAALFWTPAPLWDGRLTVFGPRRLNIDGGCRVDGAVRLHGGFDWGGQTWLRAERSNDDDQLQFERKRLYAGVATPLPGRLLLDLTGGRQFDQEFYEDHTFSPSSLKATLPPSWFLSAALNWRFGPQPPLAPRP